MASGDQAGGTGGNTSGRALRRVAPHRALMRLVCSVLVAARLMVASDGADAKPTPEWRAIVTVELDRDRIQTAGVLGMRVALTNAGLTALPYVAPNVKDDGGRFYTLHYRWAGARGSGRPLRARDRAPLEVPGCDGTFVHALLEPGATLVRPVYTYAHATSWSPPPAARGQESDLPADLRSAGFEFAVPGNYELIAQVRLVEAEDIPWDPERRPRRAAHRSVLLPTTFEWTLFYRKQMSMLPTADAMGLRVFAESSPAPFTVAPMSDAALAQLVRLQQLPSHWRRVGHAPSDVLCALDAEELRRLSIQAWADLDATAWWRNAALWPGSGAPEERAPGPRVDRTIRREDDPPPVPDIAYLCIADLMASYLGVATGDLERMTNLVRRTALSAVSSSVLAVDGQFRWPRMRRGPFCVTSKTQLRADEPQFPLQCPRR